MINLIEINNESINLGICTRNTIKGPEKELVSSFVSDYPNYCKKRKGDFAVFYEPKIGSGYPDIVIINYDSNVYKNWNHKRDKINFYDLKILNHLNYIKQATTHNFIKELGVNDKDLKKSLNKLVDAELIIVNENGFIPRKYKDIFGIKAIIAIEAKISDWKRAIYQGLINQWFASESYILIKIKRYNHQLIQRSQATGVGIIKFNDSTSEKINNAEKLNLPNSYGSWLFNEWIGRYLNKP